jgi:hypothetical protein
MPILKDRSTTAAKYTKPTQQTLRSIQSPALVAVPSPSPSLIAATNKRSQFGFGGNHTVPSVPIPPTINTRTIKAAIKNGSTNTGKRNTKAAMTSTISARKKQNSAVPMRSSVPIPVPVPIPPIKMSVSNEGASYERKKQRAKDARVKLNEAIERLSVAINLAGTQSKQRAQAHTYWANKESPSSPSNESTNTSLSTSVQNGMRSTGTIMEEAGKTADSAKKWERPSFVGSAATMVQNLNAQCEALMRELIELKKLQNDGSLQKRQCCNKRSRPGIGIVSDLSVDENDNVVSTGDDDHELGHKPKRIKSIPEEFIDINAIIKRDRVIARIGSFLDPQSILKFMCVSKSWQFQLDPTMKSDTIWSTLCVKRFGAYSVREWMNRDEDNNMLLQSDNDSTKISQMKLYRQMSASNVKPKCHFEGNISLGGGRVNNVACAWISVVERSNGETLRSVLTNVDGETKYASLPVVELRILIQNVGIADSPIFVPEQIVSIDASTKRRGEEMFEITSDGRLGKKIFNVDGSIISSTPPPNPLNHTVGNLIKLTLFQSAVLSAFIHARACPTTTKFRQRANFAKILLNVRGTTLPLVIPIADAKIK